MTPKYPMTNKNTLMMNCPNLIKPFKANLGKLMNPDLIRRSHNIDANVKFFFILKSEKFETVSPGNFENKIEIIKIID